MKKHVKFLQDMAEKGWSIPDIVTQTTACFSDYSKSAGTNQMSFSSK